MSDIYVMRRANGDVFALDDHGRFRVPLFNSSNNAFQARLRNFGMLLFKPVLLDAALLKELVPVGGAAEVDFWLVNDPLINLKRGRLVQPAQLGITNESHQSKTVSGKAPSDGTPVLTMPPHSSSNATAVWEDEGGQYSKCA